MAIILAVNIVKGHSQYNFYLLHLKESEMGWVSATNYMISTKQFCSLRHTVQFHGSNSPVSGVQHRILQLRALGAYASSGKWKMAIKRLNMELF